jgi:hypothetical protein
MTEPSSVIGARSSKHGSSERALNKDQIGAVIIGRNEGRLLANCLSSVRSDPSDVARGVPRRQPRRSDKICSRLKAADEQENAASLLATDAIWKKFRGLDHGKLLITG